MKAWLAICIIALVALLTVTLPAAAEPAGYVSWLDYYQSQGATVVEKWPLLEITTKTGEKIIRHVMIPDTTNTKSSGRYSSGTVFIIPDTTDSGESNWRDIMMLLPATIWVGNSEDRKWCDQVFDQQSKDDFPYTPKCAYPMLIYHREGDTYDVDSTLHFLEQYKTSKAVHVGPVPMGVKKLLAGYTLIETDSLQIPSYWKDSKEVILVKDDYTIAMQAAQYAAYKNAPLVIEGTKLDSAKMYTGKRVTCIGVSIGVTRPECTAVIAEKDLGAQILMLTSSDKLLVTNPRDIGDEYCKDVLFKTNPGSWLTKTYCHDSLAAPYLAAAKEEHLVTVALDPVLPTPLNLRYPSAILVDNTQSRILVADSKNNNIHIFDSDFNLIKSFGKEGSGPGELNEPKGIITDSKGNIIVLDTYNSRIQVFDNNGTFVKSFGKAGRGPGEFDRPRGITTDSKGNILVADTFNNRTQVFDSSFNFVKSFGKTGYRPGELDEPKGITTDSKGNILVVDAGNSRIQVFDSNGKFVKSFGESSKLYDPGYIALASNGNILVTDTYNHKVLVFDSNGKFVKSFGKEGVGPGEFQYPGSITIDSKGNILVADSSNNRIQAFDTAGNYLFGTETQEIKKEIASMQAIVPPLPEYITYFASPRALRFISDERSVDYLLTERVLSMKPYGRIFGVTVADASSIVARSVFQKRISNGEKRMLVAVGASIVVPSYLSELLTAAPGFKADGYLHEKSSSGENMPKEILRSGYKNIVYGNYDLILINMHGLPDSWYDYGITSDDVLPMRLKPAVFLADSCSNLDCGVATSWREVPIGVAAMRSGAVAYLGQIRSAGNSQSSTALKEQAFMAIRSEPIGRMMTQPFDTVGTNSPFRYFLTLIGDPTYKPFIQSAYSAGQTPVQRPPEETVPVEGPAESPGSEGNPPIYEMEKYPAGSEVIRPPGEPVDPGAPDEPYFGGFDVKVPEPPDYSGSVEKAELIDPSYYISGNPGAEGDWKRGMAVWHDERMQLDPSSASLLKEALRTDGDVALQELSRTEYAPLTDLDLSGITDLKDISPLSGLANLKTINLGGTAVDDLAPLSGLKKLEKLTLSGTQVSDISPLWNLNSLRELDVSSTPLRSISFSVNLPGLKVLNLRGSKVSDLNELTDMKSLKWLSVSGTPVSDISPVTKLSELEWLDASQTNIKYLPYGVQSLKYLNLGYTGVTDISSLSSYDSLEALDLSGAALTSIPFGLKMTGLKELKLGGSKITSIPTFSGMPKLETLDLSYTTMEVFPSLSELGNLVWLNLAGIGLTDATLISWPENLMSLDLSSNRISVMPIGLKGGSLTTLGLSGTDFNSLEDVSRFDTVADLDLSGTKITSYNGLSSFPNLKTLRMQNMPLNQFSLNPSQMSSLQALDLSGTQITSLGPITKLESLRTLVLSRTPFDYNFLDVKAPHLQYLDLSASKIAALDISGFESIQALNLYDTDLVYSPIPSGTGIEDLNWVNLQKTLIAPGNCASIKAGLWPKVTVYCS